MSFSQFKMPGKTVVGWVVRQVFILGPPFAEKNVKTSSDNIAGNDRA